MKALSGSISITMFFFMFIMIAGSIVLVSLKMLLYVPFLLFICVLSISATFLKFDSTGKTQYERKKRRLTTKTQREHIDQFKKKHPRKKQKIFTRKL